MVLLGVFHVCNPLNHFKPLCSKIALIIIIDKLSGEAQFGPRQILGLKMRKNENLNVMAHTNHRQPFVVMNRLTVIHRQMSCSFSKSVVCFQKCGISAHQVAFYIKKNEPLWLPYTFQAQVGV